MIELDIKSELPQAIKWTNAHTDQLAFSVAQAMTGAAKGIRQLPESKQSNAINGLIGTTKGALDEGGPPKTATAKGWFATTARKYDNTVKIGTKTLPFDRFPYIDQNITGTRPVPIGIEKFFIRSAVDRTLSPGMHFVPTKWVKKDKSGNFKNAEWRKAKNSIGTTGRSGSNYFVGTPVGGANRKPGVYRRERDKQLRPMFMAVKQVTYKPILDPYPPVNTVFQRRFGSYLRTMLEQNVAAKVGRPKTF